MSVNISHGRIAGIVGKKFDRISTAYAGAANGYRIGAIHSFRVDVKKLRAFLRLAGTPMSEELQYPRLRKLPEQLNKFYQATGLVRNLQIQEARIRKSAGHKRDLLVQRYLKQLDKEEKKARKLVGKLAGRKATFRKRVEKIKAALPPMIDGEMIRRFLYLRLIALEKLIGPFMPEDESLHAARKILKDILYTWPWFGEDASILLQPGLFSGKEEVQSIAARLGEFQDCCVGLDLLVKSGKERAHAKDGARKSILESIEQRWKEEKETIRAEVYSSLRPKIISWQSISLGESFGKASNNE